MATILLDGVLASESLNASVVGTASADSFGASGQLIAGKIGGLAGNDTIGYSLFGTTTNTAAIINSLINGNEGNDSLTFFNPTSNLAIIQSSSIFGGKGNDAITFDANTRIGQGTSVQGNEGNDTITFTLANFALINGNEDNDIITVNQNGIVNQTKIFGGIGNDSVTTGIGSVVTNTTIQGNEGLDTINLAGSTFQNVLINGNQGNDSIVSGANTVFLLNSVTVRAGIGNDLIDLSNLAAPSNARIFGDEGNNTLIGGAGADTITGGTGNDTITGGAGINVLSGGTGDDQFTYSVDAQLVTNGALVDSIVGGEGSDSIVLTGNIAYTVAAGDSFARAQSVESIVTVGANANFVSLTLGATAFTAGIRNIDISSASADNIINVAAAVAGQNLSLTTGSGNSNITGGAGNDTITGGAGDDAINAGAGANVITDAGNGADVITHASAASTVAIAVTDTGTVTLTASQIGATATTTAGGARTVDSRTSTAAVVINGAAGNNNQTFTGGIANDLLTGGSANDVLNGGAGNDTITGGDGADFLTGGTGADRFVYAVAGQSAASVAANTTRTFDSITDFTGAQGDNFNLDEVGVNFAANATATVVALAVNNVANFADLGDALVAANGAAALGVSTTTSAAVFDITLTGTGLAAAGFTRLALVNDGTAALAVTDLMVQMQFGADALAAGNFTFTA